MVAIPDGEFGMRRVWFEVGDSSPVLVSGLGLTGAASAVSPTSLVGILGAGVGLALISSAGASADTLVDNDGGV